MISVCMITYNGEKFLKRQLDTILEQLASDDELVIADDSSTDGTIEIIKSYHDRRIRLFENNHFRSPIFNMEFALKQARGDYIFLADQDDVWLPEKVQKVTEKLLDYDIVVCDSVIIDDKEQIIRKSYFDWKNSRPGFWKTLKKNAYLGCASAFNRKILDAALPFPKKIAMHDIWIGLVSECVGKSFFIYEPLMKYRRHDNNYTAAIQKDDKHLSDFTFTYKIIYRLYFLAYIAKRYLTGRFKSRQRVSQSYKDV